MKEYLSINYIDKLTESLKKSPEDFFKNVSRNTKEYESMDELVDAFNAFHKDYFISQLNIINLFSSKDYNKLLSIDLSTRNGLNYKTITEVGDYRVTQVTDINNKNILIRRYFILDFTNTVFENEIEITNEIYEIDMYSFSILISEISSAKQDIEDNIELEEAIKYLSHLESIFKRLIEKYHELMNLNFELDRD